MVVINQSESRSSTETIQITGLGSMAEPMNVVLTVTQIEPDEDEKRRMEVEQNKSQKLYTSFVKGSTSATGVYNVNLFYLNLF